MAQISLPTGKVVHVSTYEYLFILEEKDVDDFFQQLIAEDAGIPAPDNPFSSRRMNTGIDYEEDIEIEEEDDQE